MKKILTKNINFVICTVIIIGFACIEYANYSLYQAMLKDDIQNISKLTSSNICAELSNDLNKPIHISLTMANDAFLKDWLHSEVPADTAKQEKIQEYLASLQRKFGYSSVFLVSTRTGIYYHYEKLHKTVSPNDPHDVWYYDFLDKKAPYGLIIDTDEAASNILTVFINCRIVDTDGTTLGVVGVGLKMTRLQEKLLHYETNFNLQVFLAGMDGRLQASSDLSRIGTNIADTLGFSPEADMLKQDRQLRGYWLSSFGKDDYFLVRYLENFDWYLLVKKDTAPIRSLLFSQIVTDLVGIAVIIGLLVLAVSLLVSRFRKTMLYIAMTDELTGLQNRRAFGSFIAEEQEEKNGQPRMAFILDIDRFKAINDTHGHLFGDTVLRCMGNLLRTHVKNAGHVFRWGGDEFFGILHLSREDGEALLNQVIEAVRNDALLRKHHITLSVGAALVLPGENVDRLLSRADKALYVSKERGRNRLTIIDADPL